MSSGIPHSITSEPSVPELFLLDPDPSIQAHVPRLQNLFHVTTGNSVAAAAQYLQRTPRDCQFLVSDVSVNGQDTFEVFRAAKALPAAPTILVTTAEVERVPDALMSGGDAVLLKPFAPNLLFSRIGRLKQQFGLPSSLRREITHARGQRPGVPVHAVGSTAHVILPDDHCPHCNALPITAFDFLSYRRAWYACLACKKVWIGKWIDY